ncbi:tetratricopeptide repeat protein [Sphingomonas sp. 1P08PE]|uniref:tetratricopeptide repeat protein n=1 Tax=Sphingomonas sp. 1P08PE TaxID=554122 RepID=UPI0039A252FB
MGWIALLLLAGIAFGALLLLRVGRPLWSLAGAALMLAATGYALQGSPDLPASPAAPDTRLLGSDEAITELRGRMFGRFGIDGAYLTAADALARSGSARYEVEAILGGLRRDGTSVQLWTALGDAIARHDRQLSPAAALAFDRAASLDPRSPAPAFFRGLAQLRMNDFDKAEASWARALAMTPADAAYRPAIASRLDMLRRLRAAVGQ